MTHPKRPNHSMERTADRRSSTFEMISTLPIRATRALVRRRSSCFRYASRVPRTSGELMFDHVKFGVSDYAASKAFFLNALEPLGVAVVSEGSPTYGVELSPKEGKVSLCLYQSEEKPAHLHLAFRAENRQQVEAFYSVAVEACGKDNGAPGLRPHYHANYYAAFVIGPDGHNIEVVCHEPEA